MAKNPIQAIKDAEAALLKLNSGLDVTNLKLAKTAQLAAASSKGLGALKSPSQLTSKIGDRAKITEQLIALIKEQERLEKRLIQTIEKNKLLTESTNRELVKQKVNQSVLNKEVKLTAVINAQLTGAYDKLVAKMNQAGIVIKNLTVKKGQLGKLSKKEETQLKTLTLRHEQYRQAVMRADKAIGRHQRNVGNYSGSLRKLGMSFRTLISGFGIYGGAALIAQTVISIFNVTKKLQSLSFALKAIASDQHEVRRTTEFLRDITNKFGADIITTTERYTKFLAAAKQSHITLKDTENIFRTVTKAAGVLGLKTDELTGIYLALEQMLSKGKVTTEELRRQLGERLPGAFGIMANSLGVSVKQLDKMLKSGEVLSAEALPAFAKALEKAYGIEAVQKVDTLVAAQTRLKNSWIELVDGLTGEGGGKGITFIIDKIALSLGTAAKQMKLGRAGLEYYTRGVASMVASLKLLHAGLKSTGINMSWLVKIAKNFWRALSMPAGFAVGKLLQDIGRHIAGLSFTMTGLINRFKELSLIDFATPFRAFMSLRRVFTGMGDDYEKGWNSIAAQIAEEKAIAAAKAREALLIRTVALFEEIALVKKEDINVEEEKLRISKMTTEEMRAYEQELISILGTLKSKSDAEIKGIKALEGTVAYMKAVIKQLKDQQSSLATTTKEWAAYEEKINKAKKVLEDFERGANIEAYGLETIKKGLKEVGIEINEVDYDSLEYATKKLGDSSSKTAEDIAKMIAKMKEAREASIAARKEILAGFKSGLSDFFDEQQLGGIFDMFMKVGDSGETNFKRLRKEAKAWDKELEAMGEKGGNESRFLFDSYTDAAIEGAKYMGNILDTISEQNIARYDNEIEKNKDYYAALLENENLTSDQREALRDKRDAKEREIEKKKRAEQRKQANINKALAAFETTIHTARAIAEASPNPFKIALAAALGAAQLAVILAQPIPKFAEGKNVNDNYEGAAIWGEKKREVKLSKNGNVEFSPKKIGNHLTHVKKDDIILPDAEKFISGFSDRELYEQHHKVSFMASLASASNRLNATILADMAKKDNTQEKLLKEFNKKQMSFKVNQTINVGDDIAFMLKKENTL